MNSQSASSTAAVAVPATSDPAAAASIPELVAEVYEHAPPVMRARLLEQLLRPMGVMSLFGIAGGVFANIRFRSGWQDMRVRLEDIQSVRSEQVVTLVGQVQQFSSEALDGLAQMLSASPLLSGSAAAALLVTLLVQRATKSGRAETQSV
jgi:hypothetical protein